MSALDALLLAKARRSRRGVRCARVRHRHLCERPLGVLLWQLGAEPFTAAALAWGNDPGPYALACPGEPRSHALAHGALTRFAQAVNAHLEGPEPQIIVPNSASVSLLARLGRKLGYLSERQQQTADPALVRLGHHLRFLTEYALTPGQQLLLPLTEFLRAHWMTELSELEAQHLPALDAAIDPPGGLTGHTAALQLETLNIGPVPSTEDSAVAPLMEAFNAARGGQLAEEVVAPLRAPIEAHYRHLLDPAWPLLWRALHRERGVPPGEAVSRRWERDLEAVQRHLQHPRRRLRQTPEQAARTLHAWEYEQARLEAEEALDDELRMLPALLSHRAVCGLVRGLDEEHREQGRVRQVKRPRLTLQTAEPSQVPLGAELYWDFEPRPGNAWIVAGHGEHDGAHCTYLLHQNPRSLRPEVGQFVVFSPYHIAEQRPILLPAEAPWTHREETP